MTDRRTAGSRLTGSRLASVALIMTLLFVVAAWSRPGPGDALAQSVPSLGGLRVAVVDLEQVFEASPRKKALEAALDNEFREKRNALVQMEQEIKNLQQEMTLVNPGSEQHVALQEQLAVKTTRLKLYQERSVGELDGRRVTSFDEVYAEIKVAVSKVAAAERIDLVLQRRLVLQEGMPSWESVLYASPVLDITPAVVAAVVGNQ
ncbi:MAG: OmpH family outer membrane protein [Planctomycetota bacterium]